MIPKTKLEPSLEREKLMAGANDNEDRARKVAMIQNLVKNSEIFDEYITILKSQIRHQQIFIDKLQDIADKVNEEETLLKLNQALKETVIKKAATLSVSNDILREIEQEDNGKIEELEIRDPQPKRLAVAFERVRELIEEKMEEQVEKKDVLSHIIRENRHEVDELLDAMDVARDFFIELFTEQDPLFQLIDDIRATRAALG